MTTMDDRRRNDEYRGYIEELADLGSLTKWEEAFISTLTARIDTDTPLTEDQIRKLEQIYNERVLGTLKKDRWRR